MDILMDRPKVICLFDVDGTLTVPQQLISSNLDNYIQTTLKKSCDIAIVGGSDLRKIKKQLGEDIFSKYHYVFAENGLIAYKNGVKLPTETIQNAIGEDALQEFINFSLRHISELKLPFKRGTFIEFRNGMLNISPMGRNASIEERNFFEEYDNQNKVRQKFIEALKKQFPDIPFTYSIGGQISFDVFPRGWDKTYCLRHISGYEEIHFFGDKTYEGGNDYEIFKCDLVTGHRVTGPEDTHNQLQVLIERLFEIQSREQRRVPMPLY